MTVFISVNKEGSSYRGGACLADKESIDSAIAYYINNGYKILSVEKM